MNTGFFTSLWDAIAVRIQGSTGQLIAALQAWVGPSFRLSVLAYLIITLLIAAWSSDDGAFQRFFRHLWLAAIIYTLAASADGFQTYIQGFANGLTSDISRAVAGIFGITRNITANSFDIIAIKMFDKGGTVFNALQWYSPKSWVLGVSVLAYWILSLAALLVIFIIYLLSAIETNFVISFGPLFVALFFFPFTRRFFDGWVSCVVGGILIQVFTIGWLALFIVSLGGIMGTIEQSVQGNGGVDDVAMQIMMLVLTAALVGVFSTMTTMSAIVAVRISGGVYTGMERVAVPGWIVGRDGVGAFASTPAAAPAANQNPAGSSGGGYSAGPAGTGAPPREYAFNRTVGSAP